MLNPLEGSLSPFEANRTVDHHEGSSLHLDIIKALHSQGEPLPSLGEFETLGPLYSYDRNHRIDN